MRLELAAVLILVAPVMSGCLGAGSEPLEGSQTNESAEPVNRSGNWTVNGTGSLAVPVTITGPDNGFTLVEYVPEQARDSAHAIALFGGHPLDFVYSRSSSGLLQLHVEADGEDRTVRVPSGEGASERRRTGEQSISSVGSEDWNKTLLLGVMASATNTDASFRLFVNGTDVEIGTPTQGSADFLTVNDMGATASASGRTIGLGSGVGAYANRSYAWQTDNATMAYYSSRNFNPTWIEQRRLTTQNQTWEATYAAHERIQGDEELFPLYPFVSEDHHWQLTSQTRLGGGDTPEGLLYRDLPLPEGYEPLGVGGSDR
jgi:hypothetical protein